MKKIILATTFIASCTLAGASVVFAQNDYQLLAPLTGEFQESVNASSFADYAQGLINFVIGFATVLAVVMIIYGGFLYMTGESLGTKGEGRSKITNAIFGLILLLASWLILNTINPDLLNLDLNVNKVTSSGQQGGPGTGGSGNQSSNYCHTNTSGVSTCNLTQSECQQRAAQLGGTCGTTSTGGTGGNDSTYYSPDYGKNLTCVNCTNLTGVPIKPGQCEGQTCQVNSELAQKLQGLNSQVQGWQVTEAWPPTVVHQNVCHQNGSCVDANFTSNPTPQQITNFINAASNAGFGSNAVIYEVQSQSQYDTLAAQGVPTSNLLVVSGINAPHFSVYNR